MSQKRNLCFTSTNLIYLYPQPKITNGKPVILHSLKNKVIVWFKTLTASLILFRFLILFFVASCLLGLQRCIKVMNYINDINLTHEINLCVE